MLVDRTNQRVSVGEVAREVTSLLSASLKFSPEWPVISQTKRFYSVYQHDEIRERKMEQYETYLLVVVDAE